MLQRLFYSWNDVRSVVDDTIAVEQEGVRLVEELLVLFSGLEHGRGHDAG